MKEAQQQDIYYNWSEGGGAIIKLVKGWFELYEVPQYGGEERFYGRFKTKKEATDEADKWT